MSEAGVQFAVRNSFEGCSSSECEIIVCFILKSKKNCWSVNLLGERAGQRMHMNKDKWTLFSSLMGARAHARGLVRDEIQRLESVIDAFYDRIEKLTGQAGD